MRVTPVSIYNKNTANSGGAKLRTNRAYPQSTNSDSVHFGNFSTNLRKSNVEKVINKLVNKYGDDYANKPHSILGEFFNPLLAGEDAKGPLYTLPYYGKMRDFTFSELGINEDNLLNRIVKAGIVDLSESNAKTLGNLKEVSIKFVLRNDQTGLEKQADALGFPVRYAQ